MTAITDRQPVAESQRAKPALQSAEIHYLILRRSSVFLAFSLGATEVLFLVIIILSMTATTVLSTAGLGLLIGLVIIKLGLIFWIIARWHTEYYEIRPGEIIHCVGILAKRRDVYACRDVRELSVIHGLFGSLFHFGTIQLYSPALEQRINLRDIPYPTRHLEILRQLLSGVDEHHTTFIRQHGVVE